jgi:hypothetical protein
MPDATMFATTSAGLLLSIACALLLEELILGGLFRLFFSRRPAGSQNIHQKPGDNQRQETHHARL